jgi:hypothetical protein
MAQSDMKTSIDGVNGSGKSGTSPRIAVGISKDFCNSAPVLVALPRSAGGRGASLFLFHLGFGQRLHFADYNRCRAAALKDFPAHGYSFPGELNQLVILAA